MLHKSLTQQWYLISLTYKDNLLLFLISVLVGFTPFLRTFVEINGTETLIFNKYLFCFGLFLGSLLLTMLNSDFSKVAIPIVQTRSIIPIQILVKNLILQTINWILWVGMSISSMMIFGHINFVISNIWYLITIYLYILVCILFLSILQLSVWMLSSLRILGLVSGLFFSFLAFFLSFHHIDLLIYSFVLPKGMIELWLKMLVLLVFIIILGIWFNYSFKRKDL